MGIGKKIPKDVAKKLYRGKSKLEVLKKKRETAAHQKSKMLRDFAKLCKREGIDSDRVNLDGVPKAKPQNDEFTENQKGKHRNINRKNGIVAHNEVSDTHQVTMAASTTSEKNRGNSSQKNARGRQRTKKGQPVLNNQIKSILTKLTASNSTESS